MRYQSIERRFGTGGGDCVLSVGTHYNRAVRVRTVGLANVSHQNDKTGGCYSITFVASNENDYHSRLCLKTSFCVRRENSFNVFFAFDHNSLLHIQWWTKCISQSRPVLVT